jgi:uroporphyrinogen-III synthase
MRLGGKTVLVTRQPEQAGELRGDIERRGGRAVLFPTVRILPPLSWSACDAALTVIDRFDGLVFTSPNAVRRFLDRAREQGIDSALMARRRVWAVGERTAEELTAHAIGVQPLPEQYTGASLAEHVAATATTGSRLLLPQGDLASEELAGRLRGSGLTVETVVVYRTTAPSGRDVGEIHAQLAAGRIDAVTFLSPSSARNFAALFQGESLAAVLSRAVVAVIGPVTRDALRELGVEPAVVAEVSTARGLVDALERYFEGSA